ncbi:MAG: 2Fe-2S iron-sulfur cluster-binding protein, partial [Anaerolineae bacterium]|nr:2Fe-2S iron-sulfur cluster-binding protein [Anaerolineae bacterium]
MQTKPRSVKQAGGRLPSHPSYKIDFTRPLEFKFNGQRITAFAGDTVASALWAAGIRVLGRSFKYHRPRGAFALTSGDSNTLVRVDDEPNTRGSTRLVMPGMEVKSQNTWPSLKADVMSLSSFGSRFMPVGFYYKTFIRPKSLWPTYERVLRHAAGLGTVTTEIPDTYFDKKYEFADVLVIGGGPAGMSAALSAADAGA